MTTETKQIGKMLLTAGAAITLMILAFWIWAPEQVSVPEALVGKWQTADPAYSGRAFEIDGLRVNFVTGDGSVSVGFIKKIRAVTQGKRTLYTISYSLDGAPSEVSFFYEMDGGELIRFKNQEKIIWTKDKSS